MICESDPQCPRICDPATGLCPSPDASNGTACDDGTFCTVNDVCTSGVCRGVPRNCTFLTDQCNDGVCNEADGRCEAAPRVDGTACQADSDPCTTDTCEAGSCTATPVVCAPQDICHLPGTCDAATGTCTNPEIACDDSDPCTADSCDPASGCVFQPVTGFAAATCIFEGSSLRPAVCQRMPRHIQNRITRAARRITLAAAADGNLKKVRLARASRDLKVAMKKARKLAQKRKPHDCAQELLGSLRDARNRVQQLRRAL